MINLHERMLPTTAGIEPATSWSQSDGASNWATEAGSTKVKYGETCSVFTGYLWHQTNLHATVVSGGFIQRYPNSCHIWEYITVFIPVPINGNRKLNQSLYAPQSQKTDMCAQWRFRSACAFAQSDQNHLWAPSLWKHAYSNILKILPTKNESFQIKKTDFFL